MILVLYCMVICFCAYVAMIGYDMETVRVIVLLVGIVFFWIADYCYDKTIKSLKKEIKDLKEEINHIKE